MIDVKLSPGAIVRALLGDRMFRPLGRVYRRVFVDLDRVLDAIGTLPRAASVLDVGGGDGDLVNRLLRRHLGVRITMIDVAPVVGGWIEPDLEARTTKMPRTSIADFERTLEPIDHVMVNDVVHHVPPAMRAAFADDLARLVLRERATLTIKDIEPEGGRAYLACWADRYITGDRHVVLIGRQEMIALIASRLPGYEVEESELFVRDSPNYLLRFAPARG